MTARRLPTWTVLSAVFAVVLLFAVRPAAALETADVQFWASVNGRDVATIDSNRPLRLESGKGADVKVRVANNTDRPLTARSVRLHGKVMGLTFYSYDTLVDMRLDPGQSDEREFFVDLAELEGQATGLLPGRVTLLDERRKVLASEGFPVDVQGSLGSVFGIFGLAVAAVTGLLLIAAIIRLATHRLPLSRWSRGTRFGVPGVGLGMVATFSLSAFRILSLDVGEWLPFLVVGGVAGFLLGYFTPNPDVRDVRQEFEVDA